VEVSEGLQFGQLMVEGVHVHILLFEIYGD
jgi:hypothetical protein